jgi:hypothetical protein
MTEAAIPYELTFEPRPNYLYARVEAKSIDEETSAKYLREVARKCRELDCDRLLLERDIPAILPPGSLYFTTKGFRELMDGVRVAWVNPYREIDKGMNFAILVATNIGGDFTLQPDIEAAEKWLLT